MKSHDTAKTQGSYSTESGLEYILREVFVLVPPKINADPRK